MIVILTANYLLEVHAILKYNKR